MASFDRGTKRQCLNCGTKFYDLNKVPILCPNCGQEFVIASQKAAPAVEEAKVEAEETEIDTAAAAAGAEVISLEEAEEAEEEEGDEIPDVEDVEVDDELGGDENDVFLEDDEDDEGIDFDVSSDDEDDV